MASSVRKSHDISPPSQPLLAEDPSSWPSTPPTYSPPSRRSLPSRDLIDAADEPCPDWAAENPDRALALLFVAPRDCAAVDVSSL